MLGRVLLVTSAVLGSGCSGDPAPADEPADPGAPGPFAVGVTTLTAESEGRTLPVEVWYPAAPEAGSSPTDYPVMLGVLELARLPSGLGAVRDAAPDPRGAPYPVVIFSHGNGGLRTQSVYLTEHLASHGMLVAAPDHVGNTITEQVGGGGLAPAEAARVRPLDVSRTLDALLAPAGDAPTAGLADATRVGVAGHSFGGYTALRIAGASVDPEALAVECAGSSSLVCRGFETLTEPFPASARDPRFRAALPQAPGGAAVVLAGGHPGFADVAIPTAIQAGTTDAITPFEEESLAPYQALPPPAYLLGLDRAGHFTFSNVCELLELTGLTLADLRDGCRPEDLPWRTAHRLLRAHATAFFRTHLMLQDHYLELLAAPDPLPEGVAMMLAR